MLTSITSSASASRPTSVFPDGWSMRRGKSTPAIAAAVASARHSGKPDARQQDDGDAPGQRVGQLQAGNGAVETAEAVGNDQMTSAGQSLHQDTPGTFRGIGGGSSER